MRIESILAELIGSSVKNEGTGSIIEAIDLGVRFVESTENRRGKESAEISKGCFEAVRSFRIRSFGPDRWTDLANEAETELAVQPFRAAQLWNKATVALFEDYRLSRQDWKTRWKVPSKVFEVARLLKEFSSGCLKIAKASLTHQERESVAERYQKLDCEVHDSQIVDTFDYSYYIEWIWNDFDFGISPIKHFELLSMTKPWLRPHPLFDSDWFAYFYPESTANGQNSFFFFVNEGWKNGYNPTTFFSTESYLKRFPNLVKEGINPLCHANSHPQETHQWVLEAAQKLEFSVSQSESAPLSEIKFPKLIASYVFGKDSSSEKFPQYVGHLQTTPDSELSVEDEIALALKVGIDAFALKIRKDDDFAVALTFINACENHNFSFLLDFSSFSDSTESLNEFSKKCLQSKAYFGQNGEAVIIFPDDKFRVQEITRGVGARTTNDQVKFFSTDFTGNIYDYLDVAQHAISENLAPGVFSSVSPGFDNSPTNGNDSVIYNRSTPHNFSKWLRAALHQANRNDSELLFIESWNDWENGSALLPNQFHGFGYLNATQKAVREVPSEITDYRKARTVFQATIADTKAHHSTALIFHVYYVDLLDEVCEIIRSLGELADAFLTVPHHNVQTVRDHLAEAELEAVVIPCWNWGRDVRPFLEALKIVQDLNYDYLLKLHTKKSHHRSDGSKWRRQLYEKLTGTAGQSHSIVEYFEKKPDVGIIGPAEFLKPGDAFIYANRPNLMKLLKIHGLRPELPAVSFFGGTMFWARCEALKNIEIEMCLNEFESELLQVDGTLAHAFERFFSILATNDGFSLRTISDVSANR